MIRISLTTTSIRYLMALKGGLPTPPEGYGYVVDKNGYYLVGADGAYILEKI